MENKSIAIFIDAENIPAKYAKSIFDIASDYGEVIIKRIYGDWTQKNIQGWREQIDNILKKLTQKGLVVRLSHNLFIEKQALEKLMQECLNLLKNQSLDVQSMKEYFNLSRKYAIAYLEYLDKFPQVSKEAEKRFLTNI
nr:SelB C-terminal domain-containing protein [Campylobacter jejuni]